MKSILAKISTNGRLTIPLAIRKKYHLKSGTRVRIIDDSGEIQIIPITKEVIRKNLGSLNIENSLLNSLLKEKKVDQEL